MRDFQCQGITRRGTRCKNETYLDGVCNVPHARRLERCPNCSGFKTARGHMCHTIGCGFRDYSKDTDEDRIPAPELGVIDGGAR